MKFSRYRLIIAMAALFGLLVLFWPEVSDSERDATSSNQDSERNGSDSVVLSEIDTAAARPRRIARDQEPKPWRADPKVVEMYSENNKEDFSHSDLAMFYESQGFTNYMELMREALSGDSKALGRIFTSPTTDGAASESFARGIERIVEQLGEHYFAHQLSRQNLEVQRRIIEALWPGEFDEIADGHTPVIGNQICIATAQLAMKIKEAQVQERSATK